MSKHTPGPWKWYWRQEEGEANCGVFYEERKGMAISVCRAPRYEKQGQWEANARLISAAPDLLEALKLCLEQLKAFPLNQYDMSLDAQAAQAARAAIAKAEGK